MLLIIRESLPLLDTVAHGPPINPRRIEDAEQVLVPQAVESSHFQIGLIAGLEIQGHSEPTLRAFQLFMLALAATGLMLGAVVTERRRLGLALADSEGRRTAILNTARDGVLTIDAHGSIQSINPVVPIDDLADAEQFACTNVGFFSWPARAKWPSANSSNVLCSGLASRKLRIWLEFVRPDYVWSCHRGDITR
jgi:hypothetical protein